MRIEIRIAELRIGSDVNGDKFIYPSLFDIKADSKENLNFIVDNLIQRDLFNFKINGIYEGIDSRDKLHWTYDEGNESMLWIFQLCKCLDILNKVYTKDSIKLCIDKKDIINAKIRDAESSTELSYNKQSELVDNYIYNLVKFLRKRRINTDNIIKTRLKGKNTGLIKVSNRMYICK